MTGLRWKLLIISVEKRNGVTEHFNSGQRSWSQYLGIIMLCKWYKIWKAPVTNKRKKYIDSSHGCEKQLITATLRASFHVSGNISQIFMIWNCAMMVKNRIFLVAQNNFSKLFNYILLPLYTKFWWISYTKPLPCNNQH